MNRLATIMSLLTLWLAPAAKAATAAPVMILVPLPESIQQRPVVGLTVLNGPADPAAVDDVIRALTSKAAADIFARDGLQPVSSP